MKSNNGKTLITSISIPVMEAGRKSWNNGIEESLVLIKFVDEKNPIQNKNNFLEILEEVEKNLHKVPDKQRSKIGYPVNKTYEELRGIDRYVQKNDRKILNPHYLTATDIEMLDKGICVPISVRGDCTNLNPLLDVLLKSKVITEDVHTKSVAQINKLSKATDAFEKDFDYVAPPELVASWSSKLSKGKESASTENLKENKKPLELLQDICMKKGWQVSDKKGDTIIAANRNDKKDLADLKGKLSNFAELTGDRTTLKVDAKKINKLSEKDSERLSNTLAEFTRSESKTR
ncbi:MAG: hypothetical protein K0R98_1820 [Rickettsiaceae bacterium]|jgi:hypothetical protein|nr:hypothetical protein [Rickettsiaceae bacterium]